MIHQRTFIKETSSTAIGVFVLLLAVLVAVQAVKLLDNATGSKLLMDAIITLLVFWTLSLLPIVLILTAYISSLTVLSRYWRDSEMSVWLASGLSLYAWLKPLATFALPFTILTACVSMWLMPWSEARSREFALTLQQKQETAMIQAGSFSELGNKLPRTYFIESFDATSGQAHNLFIREINAEGRETLITAEHGRFVENSQHRSLELTNGHRYSGSAGQADFDEVAFEKMTLIIGTPPKLVHQDNHRRTIPTAQLIGSNNPIWQGELMWRTAMPISVLVLSLLALPLSYSNHRQSRNYNLLFAIIAFLIYENGLNLVRSGISKGDIPLWAGISLPHILMTIIALLLLYRRNRPAQTLRQTLQRLNPTKRPT